MTPRFRLAHPLRRVGPPIVVIAILLVAVSVAVTSVSRDVPAADAATCTISTPDAEYSSLVESSAVYARVWRLYQALLLRQPDGDGLSYWVAVQLDGYPLDGIADSFVVGNEFQTRYGNLDNTAFVRLIYNNVLCRDADAEGEQYWVGLLNDGTLTRAEMIVNFSELREFMNRTQTCHSIYPAETEATGHCDDVDPLASNYLDDYELSVSETGTMVSVTVGATNRTINTNALPDHETGSFPNSGNPHTITAQSKTWRFPATPSFTGAESAVNISGVAVNGIKFEPGTAELVTCGSGETYRVEGLQTLYNLGMDVNNAHVQPSGEYHYHGASTLLVEAYTNSNDLVHVGFASDGHLIYYSKSGAYAPGYALSTQPRTGTGCTGSSAIGGGSIAIAGSTPDGTYTSDWVFDESRGPLDTCNGVTLEGQYVYFMTDDFPYLPRCMNGDISGVAGVTHGGGPPSG